MRICAGVRGSIPRASVRIGFHYKRETIEVAMDAREYHAEAILRDGRYWDEIHMSILLDEWAARNRR